MIHRRVGKLGYILLGIAILSIGCDPPAPVTSDGTNSEHHHGHDHDHGHGHHEKLGPNGGHILELGDEQYHAEWVHDDEAGRVEVIMLDGDAQEEIAVGAMVANITVVVDGEQAYALDATNAENGLASRFAIVAPDLLGALTVGEGVEAKLTMEIDGQRFSSAFENHDHHGHDH